MKVKVIRTESNEEQITEVEMSECSAVDALTVIDALFNSDRDNDYDDDIKLLH